MATIIVSLLLGANVGRARSIQFHSSVSRGSQTPVKFIYPSIVEFRGAEDLDLDCGL